MGKSFASNLNVASNWITTDINHGNSISEESSQTSQKETDPAETKKTVKKETSSAPKEKKAKTADEKPGLKIQGSEKKTHQTSILLKESIFAKLESISKKNNISINNCINQILEQVLV